MSDNERDQQDKSTAEDDVNEDLEVTDEDADQVRGGLAKKEIGTERSHEGFK